MTKPLVSFVVPVFNEELSLPQLYVRVSEVMSALDEYAWECVLVDDGSRDRSSQIMQELCKRDPRVRGVRLTRNFGSHAAIAAGIDRVSGECAVIMAADLQDPPEIVPEFLKRWRAGHEVVWGTRADRPDGLAWRAMMRAFYWLVRRYALANYPRGGTGSFCLVDRKVVQALRLFPERNRLTFGIVAWLGLRQCEVSYLRTPRAAGKSGWTFGNRVKSALDTFVGFSFLPIRSISYLGLLVSLVSFCLGVSVLLRRLTIGTAVMGWTSVMAVMLFLGGLQLIMLGVLGEYVWRILDEARGRPLFVVEHEIGSASNPVHGPADTSEAGAVATGGGDRSVSGDRWIRPK